MKVKNHTTCRQHIDGIIKVLEELKEIEIRYKNLKKLVNFLSKVYHNLWDVFDALNKI